MTDCQKILAEIELFLDEELESGKCVEIRAHLAECHGCSDKAEFRVHLRTLVARTCGCENSEVPPALVERVLGRLAEDSPHP